MLALNKEFDDFFHFTPSGHEILNAEPLRIRKKATP